MSHPTGNENVRHALACLLNAGLLSEFHTSIAAFPGNQWARLGSSSWGKEFQRRAFDPRLARFTRQHPSRELGRLIANRGGLPFLTRHETGIFSVDAVYQGIDRNVAECLASGCKSARAVYCYEDGALATFTRAKELSMLRVYDLPIAYWQTLRSLIAEERERLPAWAETLGGGLTDSAAKLNRKTAELELANIVVVPSQFVADSLPDWTHDNRTVVISPFGSPDVAQFGSTPHQITDPESLRASPKRPLRILFAGSMGQRKGLGDLMEAVCLLDRSDVELVCMGALQAPMEFYNQQCPRFTYEPGRPHAEVLELMRSCDVLCLPSIVEGRALVMQEAMSQGLPIIITANTGGEDLIDEGQTGFLVDIRSPEQIAEKIAWFADHRDMLPDMKRAAQIKAASYTWTAYGNRIVEGICEAFEKTAR